MLPDIESISKANENLRSNFPGILQTSAEPGKKVMIINHQPNLIIQMIYDWNASELQLSYSRLVSLSCNENAVPRAPR